ncbi:MAG: hypothetical protein QNK22_08610 [Xanthomonadales bacterium]|nr:hypothetical protein [Xanthomonadales bacterium]
MLATVCISFFVFPPRASVLDVIHGTSLKVLSNYTNHVTDTPLDAAFQANDGRRAIL